MTDDWQKHLTQEERRDLKRYRYTAEPIYRDLAEARMERDTAKGLPTDGETCDSCGSAVAAVWHARDEEWEAVVGGPGGIRCVRCFAAEAGQKGIHLAFVTVPFEGNWTTGLLAALEALEEAQGHWRRCEEGWNKVIKQAEGFLRERDEAQGKLGAVEELRRRAKYSVGVNELDRILSKEGE
jgi:hypothetical protein